MLMPMAKAMAMSMAFVVAHTNDLVHLCLQILNVVAVFFFLATTVFLGMFYCHYIISTSRTSC